MNLNTHEKVLSDDARKWIKENEAEIVSKFVQDSMPVETPVSIFIAGSPGAGKTEFSKRLIEKFGGNIVRIDADDIRDMLPQYHGGNAYVMQGAAALGVEKIYDCVLKKKLHALIDGTFQKYEKALSNIKRSLQDDRLVEIFYVYQDPSVAWDFTQKREVIEGRNIPKEAFIGSIFASNENIKKVKQEFLDLIKINIVLKDISNKSEKIWYNVSADDIDRHIKIGYTPAELENKL